MEIRWVNVIVFVLLVVAIVVGVKMHDTIMEEIYVMWNTIVDKHQHGDPNPIFFAYCVLLSIALILITLINRIKRRNSNSNGAAGERE